MLEFNWLAIGNASLQLDYDPALVAITGYTIPFTGLLAKGEIDLGKPGDARAQLKVAGGFRVMTPEGEKKLVQEIDKAGSFELGKKLVTQERKKLIAQLPEILFDVEGENIRFADLLSYTTKLAAKTGVITKQIPVTVFPSMTLHKVWGHLALVDTRIADKEYKAGLGLQVETEFWQRKAGFRIALLPQTRDDKTTFQLSGWGYLPPLAMTARGKDIVRLHGEGEDKGPRLAFLFNPQMPDRGHFLVNATLIIPGLGLKQAIKFQWYYWWLVADFESKFAGFSVVFGVRLNTNAKPPAYALQMPIQPIENIGKQEVGDNPLRPMTQLEENRYKELEKWRQLYIKFGFKDDFAEFLNKQLVPALRSLKTQSLERLDKISLFIAQQQEPGTDTVSKEIEKTDEEIARLK